MADHDHAYKLPARLPGVTVPEVRDLKEVTSMLAERVMEWTRQWEQDGFQKGLEKGLERALDDARSALVRLLEQRFGSVPDAVRRRVAMMGSVEDIIAVTARVATAASLDALGLT